MNAKRRKQKGFSLIELLVVVAIILIISAIAIPNLVKAKCAADNIGAVGALRAIIAAEEVWSNQCGTQALPYTPTFIALATDSNSTSGCSVKMLDPALGQFATRSGYFFQLTTDPSLTTPAQGFSATAIPASPGFKATDPVIGN
jgi:type IV pilus assembly protein PilA